MKRDMELIRKILICLETREGGEEIKRDYTDEQIGYHNWLIMNAGLAAGTDCSSSDSQYPQGYVFALNWAGHEFLATARDEGRWKKAMQKVNSVGGEVTLPILQSVLTNLLSSALGLG
jgi:Hypothetical protein (DUF2513)